MATVVPIYPDKPEETSENITRAGVIDIGSNSLRLVVFDGPLRAPVPIFNEKILCGLGKSLYSTGLLDPKGVQMALDNLPRFAAAARAMNVVDLHVVATSAVRDAKDGKNFVDQVRRDCGLVVDVLSGGEEARLSALGVCAGLVEPRGIVGDLGGGSLELVRVVPDGLDQMVTLPLGSLRLNELTENGGDAAALIKKEIAAVKWLKKGEDETFHLVGGAWRTLARIHMAQAQSHLRVIDGYSIRTDSFMDFIRLIAKQSDSGLLGLPGLASKRIATVRPAARILRQLIKVIQPKRIAFSAHGLREGLIFDSLSASEQAQDPLLVAVDGIAGRFDRFPGMSSILYGWIRPIFTDSSSQDQRLMHAACRLSDIGWFDHPNYRAEHAFRRTLTMPLMGIDHPGRACLALALKARYGGGGDASTMGAVIATGLTGERIAAAKATGQALRLGFSLAAGDGERLNRIGFERTNKKLILRPPEEDRYLVGETVRRRFSDLAGTLSLEAVVELQS